MRNSPLHRSHSPLGLMLKILSTLALIGLLSTNSATADVLNASVGRWLANIDVGGQTMKFGIELYRRADGSSAGDMIAVDRGFAASRLTQIVEKNGNLEIDGPRGLHLSLQVVDGKLAGSLQQGGKVFSAQFEKIETFGEPLRAQTPRAPFPYRLQELVFSSADGTKLSATLSLPAENQSRQAVVLIHGTGPQDRDQNEDGHQSFAVLADYLTRHGIAVLRFDKRGVKRSAGSYEAHTQADLVADVQAAVAVLRERRVAQKIGIVGHSEGAEVAARVAAQSSSGVDFMVSLSGPGQDLIQVLDYENAKSLQLAGASASELAVVSRVGRQFLTLIQTNPDQKLRMTALQSLMRNLVKEDRDVLIKYRSQLPVLNPAVAATPWAYSALQSHPQDDWRQVKIPALILHGGKDMQISADDNVPLIRTALRQSGNQDVQIDVIANLNHNLQTAGTGGQEEYSKIAETLAPQVMEKIAAFVRAR
ncbi:alpha/beta hydrolase family protein [Undibacterium sp.]|uniref:alpha/beta hydrolase family protein n=1 Tax=Undibacterium sp. TaxID=1914977 RepID=UPI00374FED2C